jgi:hypothetical protein
VYRKRRPQATVPQPEATVESLYHSVLALKELAETMAGQRGLNVDANPSWQDLIDIGLIQPDQVPKDVGRSRVDR